MPLRVLHAVALLLAVFLPILITVLLGLSRLLAAMGDQAGAHAVDRLMLVGGTSWVVALVVLVLLHAIRWELPPGSAAEEFSEPTEEP